MGVFYISILGYRLSIWVLLLSLQVILGIVFVAKDIWVKGFLMYPFGLATRNFNRLIHELGTRFPVVTGVLGEVSASFGCASSVGFILFWVLYIVLLIVECCLDPLFWFFDFLSVYFRVDTGSILFWVVVLVSIMLHELGHGVIAEHNKVDVKSVGFLAVPIGFFVAYVYIDFKPFFDVDPEPKLEANRSYEELSVYGDFSFTDILRSRDPEYMDVDLFYTSKKKKRYKKKKYTMTSLSTQPRKNGFDDEYSFLRIEDPVKRQILKEIFGAGLLVNFGLLLSGLLFSFLDSVLVFPKYLVEVNLLLIVLNLLPLTITDGGRLLLLVLKERTSPWFQQSVYSLMKLLTFFFITSLIL